MSSVTSLRRIPVFERAHIPVRTLIPDCPECQGRAVRFIKGLTLCAAHLDQLTQVARLRESRTVGTITSSLLAALTG